VGPILGKSASAEAVDAFISASPAGGNSTSGPHAVPLASQTGGARHNGRGALRQAPALELPSRGDPGALRGRSLSSRPQVLAPEVRGLPKEDRQALRDPVLEGVARGREVHAPQARPLEAVERGKRKWAYKITVLGSKGDVVASYLTTKRNTEAIRKALRRAKEEAGFSPDIIARDGLPAYDRGVKVPGRRTRDVRTHFEGGLIPYGRGVLSVSNNRIERHRSEIAPKTRSMRGVKSLERGDQFLSGIRSPAQFI